MAIKCSKCDTANPSDSKYCKECATPLPPSEEVSVSHTKTLETAKEELTTGSTFAGRYQIIEELGEGGMGKVYKALDKEINAKVALKLIKPEVAADEKAIKRFRNELKLARDISHKNVCRMYDLNQEEGTYYITMEYVSGEDLKSFIRRARQLTPGTTVFIAKQICGGLTEAHKLGVIHRDLKPSNIMIDKEGNVRIMDFGIARSLEAKGITGAGVMIGTPEYMSPEQAEGEEVDQRSDIYSLGVILYELVTGQRPFEGNTPLSIAMKHKGETPDEPQKLNPQIPGDLNQLILECLAKDKEDRYQSCSELYSELTKIEKVIPTPVSISPKKESKAAKIGEIKWRKGTTSPARVRAKIPKPWLIIGFTILTVAALLIIFLLQKPKPSSLQVTGRVISLTTSPGLEDKPTWSPDGKHIAYMSDENGNFDIYVMNVDTGQALNLTEDHTGDDTSPEWSPDGNRIAYYSDRGGGGIYHLSNIGGAPILVINIATRPGKRFKINMSWSPDGSNLVYTNGMLLSIISVKGGIPEEIQLPPITRSRAWLFGPAWSPYGRRIAFTEPHDFKKLKSTIWTLTPDGSNPIKITDGNSFSDNPVWSRDGRRLFFISDMGGGSNDIWWVPVEASGKPSGSAKCLMPGVNVSSIALSPDGTRLVFSKVVRRSNIWSIPIVDNHTFTLEEAEQVTFENHSIISLDLSPDGKWIAFSSDRKGNADIWIMNKKTKELRQVTTSEASDISPDWSPDGKNIVFQSDRDGNNDIFQKPVAGGITLQLTSHQKSDREPKWSPKGDEIVFYSNRTGSSEIYVMPSSGGDPRRLTTEGPYNDKPVWSPDGSKIAFRSSRTGVQEVFYISSKGGKPKQLTNLGVKRAIIPYHWSSDGRYIYAWGNKDSSKSPGLWIVSFPDGATKPLLSGIGGHKKLASDLSSDGVRIYFPLSEVIADLSIAELA
ncbi:MAG: PD40 domain-containing protein, partial [Desulfobacteraceae bacterium]|nr:PD40 domain-containing protein [Desulfobacteraceae bacterium]